MLIKQGPDSSAAALSYCCPIILFLRNSSISRLEIRRQMLLLEDPLRARIEWGSASGVTPTGTYKLQCRMNSATQTKKPAWKYETCQNTTAEIEACKSGLIAGLIARSRRGSGTSDTAAAEALTAAPAKRRRVHTEVADPAYLTQDNSTRGRRAVRESTSISSAAAALTAASAPARQAASTAYISIGGEQFLLSQLAAKLKTLSLRQSSELRAAEVSVKPTSECWCTSSWATMCASTTYC